MRIALSVFLVILLGVFFGASYESDGYQEGILGSSIFERGGRTASVPGRGGFTTDIFSNSNFSQDGMQMDWYDEAWAKVDAFDAEGLPKSALELVNEIYARAKSDANEPQLIKSLLYQARYRIGLEEDVVDQVFADLSNELANLSDPSQAVLHSVIGELYWQYFQQNRYQYYERTAGGALDEASIETWDIRKIVETSLRHYRASLANTALLRGVEVGQFAPIVSLQSGTRADRPTLYDFLAHRALDVLENGESALTSPVGAFRLDADRDLAPAAEFVTSDIQSPDPLSMEVEVMNIFQSLLEQHLADDAPDALVHADLRRLRYVKSHLTSEKVRVAFLSALEDLAENVQASPVFAEVRHAIAAEKVQVSNSYSPPAKDFKWERKEAVAICTSAIKSYPGSRGAGYCRSLITNAEQKQLSVEFEGVVMPVDETFARISYQNVSKAYIRIVAITRDELRSRNYLDSKAIDRLNDRWAAETPVFETTAVLPDDGDLQSHSTLIPMPALPIGAYGVLVGSSPTFSNEGEIRYSGTMIVSDLSYIIRPERTGENRLYVLGRGSGHPVKGATVTGYVNSNRGLIDKAMPAKTTDADGMILVGGGVVRLSNLEVTSGDDWLFSQGGLRSTRPYEREREYLDTRFFTDRSIYRPGQTVYFKGILLKRVQDRYEILPGRNTSVVFRDVNGRDIASLDLTSNEYGTVAGEFVAPRGVLTGNMTISDNYGRVSFSVEEYKRPRFEVELEPVTEAVSLGDSITVRGIATSLAGAAIGDATVQYRVRRSTYFPWWGYRYWRPWPRSNDAEIAFGVAKTAPDGSFEVSFVAEEDESINSSTRPTYTYSVTADVTDITGETRSAVSSVSAARESIFLSLNVADQIDADQPVSFSVGAANINGQPLAFSGDVMVTRLDKPGLLLPSKVGKADTLAFSRDAFKKIAPHQAYKSEDNPTNWKRGKVVYKQPVSGLGTENVSTQKRVRWEPGAYEVRFTSTDQNGEPLEVVKYATIYASRDDDAPDNTLDWFTLLTPSVEPGQDARYLIGSTERDLMVLVEVEHNGEIVESNWVKVSREQKEFSYPIVEAHRGNIGLHVTFAWQNHVFAKSSPITVPWSNKQLSLSWETFRSKLYPGQEESWKLKISGPKGEAVASELVATLYDASLDALRSHNWNLNLWPSNSIALRWDTGEFNRDISFRRDGRNWNTSYGINSPSYDRLNLFGFSWYSRGRYDILSNARSMKMGAPVMEMADGSADAVMVQQESVLVGDAPAGSADESGKGGDDGQSAEAPTSVRTNLNETAFFFPQLETDADGATILSFTMPEALTRWRFMGIAMTKDLQLGALVDETVTQKELMVTPNAPRFFRDGDTIVFTAKVDNLTESEMSGTASIELEDATTGEVLTTQLGVKNSSRSISILPGQSTPLEWTLSIPTGITAVTYRVKAQTDKFADGEEAIVPVLTNRMLVTESLPLPMRGPGTKSFRFEKLADHESATLVNERFTLEYSPNPIWYAVQALPYLMEFPHECAEQVFSRFYANGIATHIVAAQPRLRTVYDEWKSTESSALVSNLEKNQELKAIMLEEAPWVMQANNETERKRRIGMLFDTFRMRNELVGAIAKLEQMQRPNGAWPWFEGMEDNRYITQHIVKGIGYLRRIDALDAIDDARPLDMSRRAISFLDQELIGDYQSLVESGTNLTEVQPSMLQLHHLYARTFFPEMGKFDEYEKVHDYFVGQARKYWLKYSYLGQGLISIEAHRTGDAVTAAKIVKSLRENSIDNEELGMYWKADGGYYWYQAPIETQALLIEVFNEVADDQESVSAMQLWLLKQKQTQDWETTKATTDAIYALLSRGTNLLESDGGVSIKVGDEVLSSATQNVEAGTGYFKHAWTKEAVSSSFSEITVTKTGAGPAWGAAYWQYFEDLDQITPAETPLQLQKELYVQRQTNAGPELTLIDADTVLEPGDLVKVRVVLKVDRAMEYIHLKDMRSSGFEPVNVLSQYKWQDGLGYYESTRDAATHFFISYLPVGTFVFEYPVRVSHRGDFSNGITTVQSMYAPEFTSHSAGVRVQVGQ